MHLIDNYCAFSLLKTGVKKLLSFYQELLKSIEYWIFNWILGSIYDAVIRKMIVPGKILYVLIVSLMVHVNTKFHDSSQSQLARFQRWRSVLVAKFSEKQTILDFLKSQFFCLRITFKLVTSSYLNHFNSLGKMISSWSWSDMFGKDIFKKIILFLIFFFFALCC